MKKLYQKLFDIQKMNISVTKDGENTFFKTAGGKASKYTTLENLLKVISPILQSNNLLLYHKCSGGYLITTVVDMDSFETETSEFQLTNTDPQKQGSAITYAKRYNISALFNVTTEKDDDGNKGSGKVDSKKEFTERTLSLLQGKATGKSKAEVMQMLLEIKKTMTISQDVQEKIDLFLNSLS